MHGKEAAMRPLLEEAFGVEVEVPAGFDTDAFGTFTREIKRPSDQLETARLKALAAIEKTGTTLAVASEGSFAPHPALPLVQSNLELVLLIDTENEMEVTGTFRSKVQARGKQVDTVADALKTAREWGFPEQGIIVRRGKDKTKQIYKDCTTDAALREVCERLLSSFMVRSIYVETDMRAHRCPARMEAISRATEQLIENIRATCSRCGAPGFVVTRTLRGLPCHICNHPTDSSCGEVRTCQTCQYEEECMVAAETRAEPANCAICNP
jgi:hypothetical protein